LRAPVSSDFQVQADGISLALWLGSPVGPLASVAGLSQLTFAEIPGSGISGSEGGGRKAEGKRIGAWTARKSFGPHGGYVL